ncbi:MAG: recombinase family protein [Rhodobacter sp.]|nr:recombinase family protein [Rhodobacter sp.]
MNTEYDGLLMIRVSTTKGAKESEGPEWQLDRGLAFAQNELGIHSDKIMVQNEIWSGRDEQRPGMGQAFDIAEKHGIPHVVFFDIDRFTRAGPEHYGYWKRKFAAIGCAIHDVKGIIQPETNSLAGTGGELGPDFAYEWSVYSPSEKAEVMEAQMAKDEARKILGRAIPAQIRGAQAGRTIRAAPYGYSNIKITDENGCPEPSKEPNEAEAVYIRHIFEGLAAGQTTREVCNRLNSMGFLTRKYRKWDATHTKVVGTKGGQPLTPKRVLDIIARPVYAGFICEKWTHRIPTPANHEGLVSVELWNRANRGRWQIIKDNDSPTGWTRLDLSQQTKKPPRQRHREEFGFKALIRCHQCGRQPYAGFSRSRNGDRYGYYFCAKGHKQISVQRGVLHQSIRTYLQDLRFTPELTARLEYHLRELWVEKMGGLNQRLIADNTELTSLRQEADALLKNFRHISNPRIVAQLEQDYEALLQRIKLLEANRDEKEFSEADFNRAIQWAKYLLEHLDELIVDADDSGLRAVFWSLIFQREPTLEELQLRTAPLSPLVRFRSGSKSGKSGVVEPNAFRSNQLWDELMRWYKTLQPLENVLPNGFKLPTDGEMGNSSLAA